MIGFIIILFAVLIVVGVISALVSRRNRHGSAFEQVERDEDELRARRDYR
jgi:large-conductance mechanosensitive channel